MEYREFTEDELKWIKSFQKLMKKAPKTLFMFVGSGIDILTKDENNDRYMNGSMMDNRGTIIHIPTNIECDGGDW